MLVSEDFEPVFLGAVTSIEFEGHLVVLRMGQSGMIATNTPSWLEGAADEVFQNWQQVDGGIYWPALRRTLKLPELEITREELKEALRELIGVDPHEPLEWMDRKIDQKMDEKGHMSEDEIHALARVIIDSRK